MKTPILLLILSLLAIHTSAQSLPGWLRGSWAGTGYQTDTNTTWTMRLDVGETKAAVSYPSLGCSGHWRLLGRDKKNQLDFEERITSDKTPPACANGEYVRVHYRTNSQILIEFMHPWSPDNIVATVILNRLP